MGVCLCAPSYLMPFCYEKDYRLVCDNATGPLVAYKRTMEST